MYSRLFGNLPPTRDFVMDQRSKRRWRTADRFSADLGKTLLYLRFVNDAIELGVEARDHRRGGAGGRQDSEP